MHFDNFKSAINLLVQKSNAYDDGWKQVTNCDNLFISKCDVRLVKSAAASSDKLLTLWTYHILYSFSYAVPVLYFNASTQSGSLLTVDDILALIPDCYVEEIRNNRWTTITQQEHPYLRQPFYQLHPCKTENILNSRSENASPYEQLITWLSSVGPAVGLKLPEFYATV